MKEMALDWAAQGLKSKRVWNGLMTRFDLFKKQMPPLETVQRFVHNFVAGHLGGSDLISVIRQKVVAAVFTGEEDETKPFTLTLHTDDSGKPIIGNGMDENPFVLGISTKSLLRNADRDAGCFILHLDATYKLAQDGYTVVVVGVSDRARQFHLVAIFIVSQQKQPQYDAVLQILCIAYKNIVGRPLKARWAMRDADSAQRNALDEVFGAVGEFCFLMCYFHVLKKVCEKTRSLPSILSEMVLRHIHELHFARDKTAYRKCLAEVESE